ncbi:MAG: hypothetical protein JNL34_05055 [Anaerolineae bacterium]|nr:hypothetical protein [Anaerolineae bacterium]
MPASRRFTPVERIESGRYVFLLAVSFALAVIATRGFLELTGYPQLGSTTLHIAHLLWGGLALIIALLAVLIFANRWVMLTGAVLGGFGVGLFIDEVGKFITVDNDYFFPWAAPIIYAVLLVLVLVVLLANRNRPRTPRADLYHALEAMTELIDDDLEASERARIEEMLERVLAHTDDPLCRQLAEALLGVVQNPAVHPKADRPGLDQRIRAAWLAFERRRLPRPVHRWLLIILLGLFALAACFDLLAMVALITDPEAIIAAAAEAGVDVTALQGSSLNLLGLLRLVLVIVLGALAAISALLILLRHEPMGTALALLTLLIQLTVVTLLTFYLSQFAAVAGAVAQLALLFLVFRYRTRFLRDDLSILAPA